jgi:hypothetical protein
MFLQQRIYMQQQNNCWTWYFLCGLCVICCCADVFTKPLPINGHLF